MKRLILFIAFVLACTFAMGQTVQTTQNKKSEPRYEKVDAKTFKASSSVRSSSSSSTYSPTGFYYQDRKGDKYEIYVHTLTRGEHAGEKACYIQKLDKNGKPRYQKISIKPEELK